MRKIYYLSTCSTCNRIIKELGGLKGFTFQDLKTQNIDAPSLDKLAKQVGSYEALFSRRSMKFRSLGLHTKTLSEKDYRKWILEEYTFLKRPVIIIDKEIVVGNAKSEVARAKVILASTS
jgi:arsenate reductase